MSVRGALDDLLAQDDLLGGGVDSVTSRLVGLLYRGGRARSREDIARGLRLYADEAGRVGAEGGGLLDAIAPVGPLDVIDGVTRRLDDAPPPASASGPVERNAPDDDQAGFLDVAGVDDAAWRDGASSPAAKAADDQSAAELRQAVGADRPPSLRELLDQGATRDQLEALPEVVEALRRMDEAPPTTSLEGYGSDEFWATRTYTTKDGEVQGLDAAVEHLYRKARTLAWDDDGLPPGDVRSERKALILIGSPAAGKSTLANPVAREMGAVIVDADEAKKIVPGYDGGVGAGAVHEESSEIAADLLLRAIDAGDNLVLPKVGGSAGSIEKLIGKLREAGYSVDLAHMHVDADEAWRRMYGRFASSGRIIPSAIMADGIENPGRAYQILKQKGVADRYAQIDNTPPRGQPRGIVEDQTGFFDDAGSLGADRGPGVGQRAETPGAANENLGSQDGLTPASERATQAAAALADGDFAVTIDGVELRASDILRDLDDDADFAEQVAFCRPGGLANG